MALCGQCYFEGEKRRSILCLIFWRVKNPLSSSPNIIQPCMGVGRGYLSFSFGYLRRRRLWETGWRMQTSLSKDRHLGKDVSARNNAWLLIFTMMSSHDFGVSTFICTCSASVHPFGHVYGKCIWHLEHQICLTKFSMKYVLIEHLFELVNVNTFLDNLVKFRELCLFIIFG